MERSSFNSLPPPYGSRLVKDDPNYVRKPADRKARREQGVAGSYNHIITDAGNLVSNETFVQMIENLGDAYEMTEQMYGMIWWLACNFVDEHPPVDAVELARQNYEVGLRMATQVKTKAKRRD